MRKDLIIVGVLTILGMGVLIHLGNWQWERLEWKNNLIELIEQRARAEPSSLSELKAILKRAGPDMQQLEYLKVKVRGHFLNEFEHHVFAITKGKPGWHIYTPFKTQSHDLLLVNRGWVPDLFKDPSSRREGQILSDVEISGLIRVPPSQKPNAFVADNDRQKNIYHWRSLADMKRAGPQDEEGRYLPVMMDMEPIAGRAAGWPQAGTTVTNPPNRHLGYIITWYGLALSLLLVSGFYIRSRLKEVPSEAREQEH